MEKREADGFWALRGKRENVGFSEDEEQDFDRFWGKMKGIPLLDITTRARLSQPYCSILLCDLKL